jgi:hypothetical protein
MATAVSTERVQGQLSWRLQSGALEGLAEAFADVAVVEAAAELANTKSFAALWRLASRCSRRRRASGAARMTSRRPASVLEAGVFAAAGELPVDA